MTAGSTLNQPCEPGMDSDCWVTDRLRTFRLSMLYGQVFIQRVGQGCDPSPCFAPSPAVWHLLLLHALKLPGRTRGGHQHFRLPLTHHNKQTDLVRELCIVTSYVRR